MEEESANGYLSYILVNALIYRSLKILGEETKRVCWDLDLRGGVGETILHLCYLSSSPVHTALAKRLLKYYPTMIFDLYMGDEYYGLFIKLNHIVASIIYSDFYFCFRRKCTSYCNCQ